jgi:hypothetical protein
MAAAVSINGNVLIRAYLPRLENDSANLSQ